jgi:hypothetical protein
MWLTIYLNKKSRYDPVRDANFRPFARYDYDQWSYITAIFTHFIFLPRFLIGWCLFCSGSLAAIILCFRDDPENLPAWKVYVIKCVVYF